MQDRGCHRRARWSNRLVPSSWCWWWTQVTGTGAGYHRKLFYVNLNINLRYLQNVYILLDCRTGVHIPHHPCLVLLQLEPWVSRDIELKQSQPKNLSLHSKVSHFCTLLLAPAGVVPLTWFCTQWIVTGRFFRFVIWNTAELYFIISAVQWFIPQYKPVISTASTKICY